MASLVVIAVNEDGYRVILGPAEGMKESKASWVNFFQWLRNHGPDGASWWLVTSALIYWWPWEECFLKPNTSGTRPTFTVMFSRATSF